MTTKQHEEEARERTSGENPEACGDVEVTVEGFASEAGEENDSADGTSSLEAELGEARRQAAENYDRYVRARAELDNVQKRQQRELADRSRYAAEPLARDLLGALDDLERALDHAAGDDPLIDGVRLVHKNLLAALEANGIKRLESIGKPFDPTVHEAVTMVPASGQAPGTVAAEHRAGYLLHDRLLRAALVAVTEG
jgi:molecular chaperone GrpE